MTKNRDYADGLAAGRAEAEAERIAAERDRKAGLLAGARARAEAEAKGKAERIAAERDRERVIDKLIEERRATPAMRGFLRELDIEMLGVYAKVAPVNAVLAASHQEPVHTSGLVWRGKAWVDLSPSEKADLFSENRELYDLMKRAR